MTRRALPVHHFLVAILVLVFACSANDEDDADIQGNDKRSSHPEILEEGPADVSSDEDSDTTQSQDDDDGDSDDDFLKTKDKSGIQIPFLDNWWKSEFENITNTSGHLECVHGNWSHRLKRCVCHENWRLEPFWNTLGLLSGQCTQFSCSSDQQCVKALGFKHAKCPLHGWNCDCGIAHGSFGNAHAQCMYRYFALGVTSGQYFSLLMTHLWKVLVAMMVISLPFGANYVGRAPTYSLRILRNDFAWSWFFFKLGLWLYCFCILTYSFILFCWTLPLAAQFILTGVVVIFCCLLAFCNVDSLLDCDNLEICASCDESCFECACLNSTLPGDVAVNPLMFYAFDWTPYGSTSGEYECDCCWPLCFRSNFRWLIWNFPRVPQNMLGGLFGYCIGTHPRNASQNQPEDSCGQRLLTMPCIAFSNRTERWRIQVNRWLEEDTELAMTRASLPAAEIVPAILPREEIPPADKNIVDKIGDVWVSFKSGTFKADEGIFNFEDYRENVCWICQEGPGRQYWDKWTFCHHVFCEKCSTEMMKRRMPCPLCRVRSTKVVRKNAYHYGSSGQE